jgi:dehydrogenase/reductase SDR family member 12
MASYETTVETTLGIDEVFAYLSDFANVAEWDPGVVEAERLSEADPSLGTRFRVVTSTLGSRQTIEYEITDWDPPFRLVLVGTTSRLRSIDTLTFVATDTGGTRVTYHADLALRGMARVFDPTLHLAFQLIGRRADQGLREVLVGDTDETDDDG